MYHDPFQKRYNFILLPTILNVIEHCHTFQDCINCSSVLSRQLHCQSIYLAIPLIFLNFKTNALQLVAVTNFELCNVRKFKLHHIHLPKKYMFNGASSCLIEIIPLQVSNPNHNLHGKYY